MSESRNVHQRMIAVTKAVGNVAKGDKKVNGQYSFVSHDAVTKALQPHLVEQGLAVLPTVVARTQDGNRTEVDMEVLIVNVDNPEDTVTIKAFGYGIDNQDKGPGKAVSYATKYALLKAFCLETGDDPDNDAKTEHEPADPITMKARKIYADIQKASSLEALNAKADEHAKDIEALEGIDEAKHAAITTLIAKKRTNLQELEGAAA
jgi:hypothetical protein